MYDIKGASSVEECILGRGCQGCDYLHAEQVQH